MAGNGNGRLDRAMLMRELHALGFRHYPCSHTAWKSMSVMVDRGSMLCLLVGRRSIDFKYFPGQVGPIQHRLDDSAYVHGGTVVRYYYRDSGVSIHAYILDIATRFARTGLVENAFLPGVGTSLAAHKSRCRRKSRQACQGGAGLGDVYEALSSGEGEDVYLSDGVWLGAGGSLVDRGR